VDGYIIVIEQAVACARNPLEAVMPADIEVLAQRNARTGRARHRELRIRIVEECIAGADPDEGLNAHVIAQGEIEIGVERDDVHAFVGIGAKIIGVGTTSGKRKRPREGRARDVDGIEFGLGVIPGYAEPQISGVAQSANTAFHAEEKFGAVIGGRHGGKIGDIDTGVDVGNECRPQISFEISAHILRRRD
jgi:hypothetical protein